MTLLGQALDFQAAPLIGWWLLWPAVVVLVMTFTWLWSPDE